MDISLKGKGFIPREKDPRDIPYRAANNIGSIVIDWNLRTNAKARYKALQKQENQGLSSSCVAQGWSKDQEMNDEKETGQFLDLSARDIYSWIHETDGGAWGYKGGSSIKERGIARESLIPSYNGNLPPTEEFMRIREYDSNIRREALNHQIKGYTVVQGIDEMAHAILTNDKVVFGIVGTNAGWQTGNVRPPLSGESIWGHFILGIDLAIINGKRAIEFANWWSKDWGNNGFGIITEDYFANGYVYSGYVSQDIDNSWLEQTKMKDLIMLEGTQDQFVCESGRKLKIPDVETRDFLRDIVKIITGEPRVVKQTEFDLFQSAGSMPSVKADQFIRDSYSFYKDKLPLFKDIVDTQ